MAHVHRHRILTVNPGSTSTRVAFFEGSEALAQATLPAPPGQAGEGLWDELTPRLDSVRGWLAEVGVCLQDLSAVVGRGGLLLATFRQKILAVYRLFNRHRYPNYVN